jgi:Zn-dependent protease
MAKIWFKPRPPERGSGYDPASWEGWAAIALFGLTVCGAIMIAIASGPTIAGALAALLLMVGAAYGLVWVAKSHTGPE